jgi:hypothetical protein
MRHKNIVMLGGGLYLCAVADRVWWPCFYHHQRNLFEKHPLKVRGYVGSITFEILERSWEGRSSSTTGVTYSPKLK